MDVNAVSQEPWDTPFPYTSDATSKGGPIATFVKYLTSASSKYHVVSVTTKPYSADPITEVSSFLYCTGCYRKRERVYGKEDKFKRTAASC